MEKKKKSENLKYPIEGADMKNRQCSLIQTKTGFQVTNGDVVVYEGADEDRATAAFDYAIGQSNFFVTPFEG